MYIIDGFMKFAEQDIFKDGCQPDTSMNSSVDITLKAETIEEISQKVRETSELKISRYNEALNA